MTAIKTQGTHPLLQRRLLSYIWRISDLFVFEIAISTIMLALHIALYALLGSALFLAIVQLGLTAYVVSYWGDNYSNYSIDFSGGYPYRTAVRASTPDSLALLVFAACWTILVTIAALVLPWLFTRKGTTTGKLNTILGIGFAVAYFVTMAFWLAGFGDLVAKTGGNWSDYVNAIIAFAVILWSVPSPKRKEIYSVD